MVAFEFRVHARTVRAIRFHHETDGSRQRVSTDVRRRRVVERTGDFNHHGRHHGRLWFYARVWRFSVGPIHVLFAMPIHTRKQRGHFFGDDRIHRHRPSDWVLRLPPIQRPKEHLPHQPERPVRETLEIAQNQTRHQLINLRLVGHRSTRQLFRRLVDGVGLVLTLRFRPYRAVFLRRVLWRLVSPSRFTRR